MDKSAEKISWFEEITYGYGWAVALFLIVLLTLVVSYIERIIYRKLIVKLEKSSRFWDDVLAHALHKPLLGFIWLMGITTAIQVGGYLGNDYALSRFVNPIREIGGVLLLVWFLSSFIRGVETSLMTKPPQMIRGKKHLDQTSVRAIGQVLRVTVIITAILILLQTFGVPVSGVWAFGGIGGVAVGFAAKDLLANFFGGLMIFLDRPFAIGDWIRSPDREIEGTVEQIGWRLTRIRTFDKRPLYIPNGVFSSISVENPTRMMNRRIRTNVGVRYNDAKKVGAIVKDVEEMLRNHPEIDTSKTLFVHLVEFGPSSLNFQIYTFTKTTQWISFQAIQEDILLKVIDIVDKNGAEMAFPTTTMHFPEGISIKQEP